MLHRFKEIFTSHPIPRSGAIAGQPAAPSSGPPSTARAAGDERKDSHAAGRHERTTLGSGLRKLAHAADFRRHRSVKTEPDPLEGMTEAQRARLRKAAMAVLGDKALLGLILGRWPRLNSDGSYEQGHLTRETASLSRTSKEIRNVLLPKLWGAFQFCQYNKVFVYTSSAPNGWLKFKGTDRLQFGYWVAEQVLPRRLPRYESVMIPVLRDGFMSQRIQEATQEAFQHYVHRGDREMARRMLTSGLVSPFESFDGVKPLFLVVQKANAADLEDIIEGIRKLECFPGFINTFDGQTPKRRLLDHALKRGDQAVIDVLRKYGAVTHDVVVEEPPPARLIPRSESLSLDPPSLSSSATRGVME